MSDIDNGGQILHFVVAFQTGAEKKPCSFAATEWWEKSSGMCPSLQLPKQGAHWGGTEM